MRDPSRTFPDVPDAERVTALRVWHCKYRSLENLRQFPSLRTLVVASYPEESFDVVGLLSELRYLFVLHLPRVESLEPLAACKRLETLRLHTLPSWDTSGRKTVIDSLAPLRRLPELRHIELFGVLPRDKSLSQLEHSLRLETVRVQGYPQQEVARLYEAADVTDAFAPAPAVKHW